VVEEAEKGEEGKKKRGPKGGIKHEKYGRGHARKSQPPKKRRIGRRLKEQHRKRREMAEKRQQAYDNLPRELQKLLRPEDLTIAEEEK
jgi:hypothetical protein